MLSQNTHTKLIHNVLSCTHHSSSYLKEWPFCTLSAPKQSFLTHHHWSPLTKWAEDVLQETWCSGLIAGPTPAHMHQDPYMWRKNYRQSMRRTEKMKEKHLEIPNFKNQIQSLSERDFLKWERDGGAKKIERWVQKEPEMGIHTTIHVHTHTDSYRKSLL